MGQTKDILMFSLEIALLGFALAVDAAVVTFAIGLLHYDKPSSEKFKRGLLVSLAFGFFQFAMLWLGAYAGYLFTFSSYGYYFQLVVGIIFFALSVKFIQESLKDEEKNLHWGFIPILILAFATSIDAMASGVSLGTIPHAYLSALQVGVITFLVCSAFYFISQFFRSIPEKWLLRFSGAIFLFLGAQIFWGFKHVFFKG